jgi:hypothetical protein
VIPVPALFAQALDDALGEWRFYIREMPLGPSRLREMLRGAREPAVAR